MPLGAAHHGHVITVVCKSADRIWSDCSKTSDETYHPFFLTMFHDAPTEHEVLKVLDCFLEVVVDLFIFFGTASVSLQVSWQIWSNGVQ